MNNPAGLKPGLPGFQESMKLVKFSLYWSIASKFKNWSWLIEVGWKIPELRIQQQTALRDVEDLHDWSRHEPKQQVFSPLPLASSFVWKKNLQNLFFWAMCFLNSSLSCFQPSFDKERSGGWSTLCAVGASWINHMLPILVPHVLTFLHVPQGSWEKKHQCVWRLASFCHRREVQQNRGRQATWLHHDFVCHISPYAIFWN